MASWDAVLRNSQSEIFGSAFAFANHDPAFSYSPSPNHASATVTTYHHSLVTKGESFSISGVTSTKALRIAFASA